MEGFTVMLDRPLLELAKELMRPSSLVMVGIVQDPGWQLAAWEGEGEGGSGLGKVRGQGLGRGLNRAAPSTAKMNQVIS